jgi:hypothetical protein
LPMICWLGIALPDSYSWITCGFSLIICNKHHILISLSGQTRIKLLLS